MCAATEPAPPRAARRAIDQARVAEDLQRDVGQRRRRRRRQLGDGHHQRSASGSVGPGEDLDHRRRVRPRPARTQVRGNAVRAASAGSHQWTTSTGSSTATPVGHVDEDRVGREGVVEAAPGRRRRAAPTRAWRQPRRRRCGPPKARALRRAPDHGRKAAWPLWTTARCPPRRPMVGATSRRNSSPASGRAPGGASDGRELVERRAVDRRVAPDLFALRGQRRSTRTRPTPAARRSRSQPGPSGRRKPRR